MSLVLHSYWRATAPYRVRLALHLKKLDYVYAPVNLLNAEQHGDDFRRLNPQQLTPVLEADGRTLTQSLAILEWLEESHPSPPLLPAAPGARAVVRAMAAIVACDIHPLNNLRILQALAALGHPMGGPEQAAWGARWINDGFTALEAMVAAHGRGYAFGSAPTLADCCLIPQIWSSRRFGVDMAAFPSLAAVAANAAGHPAFLAAHPDRQPDAPDPGAHTHGPAAGGQPTPPMVNGP